MEAKTRIGIYFPDNDFHTAIHYFLKALYKSYKQNEKEYSNNCKIKLTKGNIVTLFNRCIGAFYWLYQNKLTYDINWDSSIYLKIRECDVYIEEEVNKLILEHNSWINSEFHVLFLETGKVKSY